MTLPSVLVIGSRRGIRLRDALFETGLTPVFRGTILAAIGALRRNQFLAVVVDHSTAMVDVMELILNLWDLDENLRIFVLSDQHLEFEGLQAQQCVSVVTLHRLLGELRLLAGTAAEQPG